MRARVFPCSALLLTLSSPLCAEADAGSGFDLTWTAPPGCPEADAVRTDALHLLGKQRTLHRLSAQGKVRSAGPQRWELDLTLELDGAAGERHLSADSCAAIADAAAVMFALMLNPDATLAPDPPPTSDTAAQSTGPELHVAGQLGVGLALGGLPLPDPELRVGVGASLSALQLWVDASGGVLHELDLDGGAGGRLRWSAVDLRTCWAFTRGASTFGPCAVGALNRLAGRGTGVSNPRDGAIAWAAAGVGGSASVALSQRVSLYLQAQALLSLARPRIFLEDLGELQRPEPVNALVDLGVQIRVW